MNTTTAGIYIRTKPDIKEKAHAVANELGFSLSAYINASLIKLIATKRIDFSLDEEPSGYLLSAMKKAKKNRKAGKASPIFTNVADDLKWLEKQGI